MAIKAGNWEMSDEEFERQYAEATARGKAETARGIYAVAARYDKAARRVVVELANGTTLLVPVRLIQGLQQAAAKALTEIEILGAGSGLYWPKLEVDISVEGMLAGVFGTKAWMAESEQAANSSLAETRAAVPPTDKPRVRPRKAAAPPPPAGKRRRAA